MTSDYALLSPWVRRFLLEHIIAEKNLSPNTQRSYRDTLRLLLPFVAKACSKTVDGLKVDDVSLDTVRRFLSDLEQTRGCGASTRNQRLAAINSLVSFISVRCPEYLQWAGGFRTIVYKKTRRPRMSYLEKPEMDALLSSPDLTPLGARDRALLLFLFNTGARADEVAHVRISDLELGRAATRDRSSVLIHGKGSKQRQCPLWPRTVNEVAALLQNRSPEQHVFINRLGQPLTRFGVRGIVKRYAAVAASEVPSIARKSVSTHTIRHTAAMHLLREGVDINTIRAWLGHESLSTTNIYAEADLEMKAKALAKCDPGTPASKPVWRDDPGLMAFLQAL
jgi:integrase/recombinase XerD